LTDKLAKTKGYTCSEYLKGYLKETLSIEEIRKKKHLGGKITTTDDRLIMNNNDRKVDVLNTYIFPSMANLIYFFEFLNENPELIDRFGDDIEDLFGLRAHKDPKNFTFPRFVRAIIGEGYTDNNNLKFNYRRRLLKIMQHSINQKAMLLIAYSKNDPLGIDDTRFRNMIAQDLEKALVWMNFLDRFTGNENKKSSRLIDF
jgi:hypothetical protein